MNLEARLTKLEQSNKRQRMIIACLALLLFTSFLFGGRLAVSTDVAAQSGRKMELNQLTITNRNGDPVVVLRGDAPRSENPGIILTGNTSVFECFDEVNQKTVSIGVQTGNIAHKGELNKIR